jgi:hypothetical protein
MTCECVRVSVHVCVHAVCGGIQLSETFSTRFIRREIKAPFRPTAQPLPLWVLNSDADVLFVAW